MSLANNLVWLFQAHRDMYEHLLAVQALLEHKQKQIDDLEVQLAKKPVLDIPSLVEELFQDQPYNDGRIPDTAWLTPGQIDREIRP